MRALLLSSLLLPLCLAACDDDGDGEVTPTDAEAPLTDAGVESDDGVGAEAYSYIFTEMNLQTPEALGPLMSQLLNNYLNRGAMHLFVRVTYLDEGRASVEGGAAQPTDDGAFTWLTEGECLDGEGALSPCSVEVGRAEAEWSGDEGHATLPVLSIYSAELKSVFPIRNADITCTREGVDLHCEMLGSITEEDAQQSWIRLTPTSDSVLLDDLMGQLSLEPDVEVDGKPAYRFGGLIEATEAPFSAP